MDPSCFWRCLQTKPCVLVLLVLFVMEALAAIGLGIYYYKDGTLGTTLFGSATTNCQLLPQTGEKFSL